LHYGGGGTPLYARAINCLFDVGLQHGMFTNSEIHTQITACTFRTQTGFTAIQPQGSILVTNCQFLSEGLAYYAINDAPGQDVAVTALNCQFGSVGQGDGYVYSIRRISDGLKEWNIIGCTFNDIHQG